jgi:hypothetical protein
VSVTPAEAAQACIDRFAGKPMVWGQRDCATLAAHLLHKRGRAVPMLKGAKYKSEAGAFRTLKQTGFACLVSAVDGLGLERIPPAAARTGDLVAMPCADARWGCALTVAVGNGRVFGYLDGVAQVQAPSSFVAAWRV